jgi:hypothetical protein
MERVELTGVRGDQAEFADIIGESGGLCLTRDCGQKYFMCDNGGDVTFVSPRVKRNGATIVVSTRAGNIFTFTKI